MDASKLFSTRGDLYKNIGFSKFFISLLSISSLIHTSSAVNYTAEAEASFDALQSWYNITSGLWDTCGWWNGANCMTVIADLAAADPRHLPQAKRVFSTTFQNAPSYNPTGNMIKRAGYGYVHSSYGDLGQKPLHVSSPSQWLNSYYDDNAWWALAWIAAYDLTQTLEYLNIAEVIFGNLSAAWPTTCNNGGIYWSTTSTYVNAISNELFLSVAAHLANRVLSKKACYVEWAQREWAWFQSVQMINSVGLIVDGLGNGCLGNAGATVWSYNQGVVLGGLVELSKVDSGNASSYLASANAVADAAIARLTDFNGIIHDVCEANGICGSDGTQFKGIFMRNLLKLHHASPSLKYKQFFETNAQRIWNHNRDDRNRFSLNWAGPFIETANASTHSSAMDAIIAALVVG